MANITGKKISDLNSPSISTNGALIAIETSDGNVVKEPKENIAPVQSINAGTNVTVDDDGNGNIVINSTASSGGSGHAAVIVNDSETMDFLASGTDNQTITANVKISGDSDNQLGQGSDNALFVALPYKRVLPDSNSIASQSKGTDVNIVRSAGSCVVNIPADVDSLRQFRMIIDANTGDQGGDSSYTVDFVFNGTRNYNQNSDLSDMLEPSVSMKVFNTATQITTTTSNAHEITVPSPGTLRVRFLTALQSAFDKRSIKFNFE